jgi:hypothetical protein
MPIKKIQLWGIIAAAAIIAVAAVSAVVLSGTYNDSRETSPSSPTQTATTTGNNKQFEIYPMDSKPYNKSYTEWTQTIWEWFQKIPLNENPGNDPNGQHCAKNQDDANVWFLAGTFGGKQVRECTVPAGRALVLLVGGFEDSFAEDKTAKTADDLRKTIEESNQGLTVHASIDGTNIPNVQKFYFVTPPYSIEFPEGNVWGVPSQKTQSMVGGWTIIVKPLPVGEYEIVFGAEKSSDIAGISQPAFSIEAVYNLKVIANGTTTTTTTSSSSSNNNTRTSS